MIQSDDFNRSAIQTVMVATVTSNVTRSAAPGNVTLTRRQSGLPRKSVVNVSQVLTIDRRFLERRIRRIDARLVAQVDAGLRLAIAL